MASSLSIVTVIDYAKVLLREVGGEAFTDAQYLDIMLKHCGTSTTFNCQAILSGTHYSYAPGGIFSGMTSGRDPAYIFTASSSVGTGVMTLQGTDYVYRLNCVGPTVVLTTGSDTRTSIDVTGCLVDFDGFMLELIRMFKTQNAKARGISLGTATMDIDQTFARLKQLEQDYRGAMSL